MFLSGRYCSQPSHKLYTRTVGRNDVSKLCYGHLTSSDYLDSLSSQLADLSSSSTLDTARVEDGEHVKVEDRPKHSVDYVLMNSSTHSFSDDAATGVLKADIGSEHPLRLPRPNLYKKSISRTMHEWLVSDPAVAYFLAKGPYWSVSEPKLKGISMQSPPVLSDTWRHAHSTTPKSVPGCI